jgi:hypothetical protein
MPISPGANRGSAAAAFQRQVPARWAKITNTNNNTSFVDPVIKLCSILNCTPVIWVKLWDVYLGSGSAKILILKLSYQAADLTLLRSWNWQRPYQISILNLGPFSSVDLQYFMLHPDPQYCWAHQPWVEHHPPLSATSLFYYRVHVYVTGTVFVFVAIRYRNFLTVRYTVFGIVIFAIASSPSALIYVYPVPVLVSIW